MAAVIPEKVHFEPGSEALKVSAELSREPSLITASSLKVVNFMQILSRFSRFGVRIATLFVGPIKAGLNMIIDPSGKLLTRRKVVSRKDVIANPRAPSLHSIIRVICEGRLWGKLCLHEHYKVIAAAVRGQLKARRRQSSYIYMDAVLHFVNENKILPRGVLISAPSVQDWACKVGAAIRKLVPHLEL